MLSEHHLTVSRTARYVVLGGSEHASELWIACHGYGQRAIRFARAFEAIASESTCVVVPEALSRFYVDASDARGHGGAHVGASWMTREERDAEISDYVEYLNALWRTVPSAPGARVTALGFSQGAATAARWAVMGEARPQRLVLWGGTMPRDLLAGDALTRLRAMTLYLVAGLHDHYATETAIANELKALQERDVTPRVLRFEGGHTLDAPTLQLLAGSAD